MCRVEWEVIVPVCGFTVQVCDYFPTVKLDHCVPETYLDLGRFHREFDGVMSVVQMFDQVVQFYVTMLPYTESMYLYQASGFSRYVYTCFSSNWLMNTFAYDGATIVPIAVPPTCR